jgi:hypothetical protein
MSGLPGKADQVLAGQQLLEGLLLLDVKLLRLKKTLVKRVTKTLVLASHTLKTQHLV